MKCVNSQIKYATHFNYHGVTTTSMECEEKFLYRTDLLLCGRYFRKSVCVIMSKDNFEELWLNFVSSVAIFA